MKAVPRRLLILGGGPVGVEMAQVVRRLGGEAVLVEGAEHLLPREPAPLGEGLGEALRRDGVEVMLGMHATAARREGDEYVLQFDGGAELRGDRLLVATGRRPRVAGIGLETVGVEADPRGIHVDEYLRAGERLWAIGDVTGIWPLTHVGEYEGDVVAANIAGDRHPANYEAVPRVTYTDPQAAAVGATEAAYSATALVSEVPKTATYTHDYAESTGFLTLLSDGERLTGAYALGPEAGEWLQQATLAIRAHVPLDVLERHDPALPELLRDLRPGGEGAAHADRRHAATGRTDGRADGRPFVSAAEQLHVSEVSPAYWRVTFDNGPVNLLDPDTVDQLAALILHPYVDNFVRLSRLPVATIAEIRGRTRGAGSEFVLATDIRFASEAAVLGQFEVGVGAVPGGGPMARLGRLVGRGRALEILLGGDDIPAAPGR